MLQLVIALFMSQFAHANAVGSDFQNFNPTYSGLDFITVHSSETLDKCVLNSGFYINRAYNSLPFFESVNFEVNDFRNRSEYSDVVDAFDFNLGYGISENWDVGVNIQSFLSQTVETDALISGSFEETGLSEVRLNTKYRLDGDDKGGFAVVASLNFNQVENNIFIGDGAGPTFNFEGVYDRNFKRVNWALNLGYRKRQPGEVLQPGVIPFDDSLIYSTALSYLFRNSDLKLVGELFGSYPFNEIEGLNKKVQSNLEGLLALKYDHSNSFSVASGFGGEIISGTATPDWRFFVGLNWAMECCDEEPKLEKVAKPEPQLVDEWAADPPDDEGPSDFDPDLLAPEPVLEDEPDETFVVRNINFKFGSHFKVYPQSLGVLEQLADYLATKDYRRIVVVGHTDSVGSDEYNMDLSRKRARTIALHLIRNHKLERTKVKFRYHGERQPVADNGNFQGRKKNRRVEFLIYY